MFNFRDSIISETQYDEFHPITHARLVARKAQFGWEYRYNFFFRDGTVKSVPSEQFDPVLQNGEIVTSEDGEHLFIPDYDRGIVQKSILDGNVECIYPMRHIFDMICVSGGLLCLQRETHRRLVRFEIGNPHPVEEAKADGIKIFKIAKGTVLYKKNPCYYALSEACSLCSQELLSISKVFETHDPVFQITSAKYLAGKLDISYCVTDSQKRGRLQRKTGTFVLPETAQMFIKNSSNPVDTRQEASRK